MSFFKHPDRQDQASPKTQAPHHPAAFGSPEYYAALDSIEGIAPSNPIVVPSSLTWFRKFAIYPGVIVTVTIALAASTSIVR